MRTCQYNNCNNLVFRTDKLTGKGYCTYHWRIASTDIDKRSIIQKAAAKAKNKEVVVVDETDLQKWYAEIMEKEIPKCWETGNWIGKEDKVRWHGSIAHCLPKKLFPSVATHPLNYLILDMYGSPHGQYDSSWQNAAKMKVWPIAIERIQKIYFSIAKNERRLINEIIKQELNPEII